MATEIPYEELQSVLVGKIITDVDTTSVNTFALTVHTGKVFRFWFHHDHTNVDFCTIEED